MPDLTPNLYSANTAFHQAVRNRPGCRGRARRNAPGTRRGGSRPGVAGAIGCHLRERPDRRAAGGHGDGSGRGAGGLAGARGRGAACAISHRPPAGSASGGGAAGFPGYFTGRWYATRYRSAGTTTSAVSTASPEA
ncbi:hypothetical protein GCM10010238_13160 [Streptomyces griseoviridis]|uniref:Uncharacterized protein n=1 Tax=Streptomyces griseoviridis TaxID=45398 RepID=A0A918GA64_STRGD|nr:hypothetical protein GCM10010238_13160 [Streptomyces niveoruber]